MTQHDIRELVRLYMKLQDTEPVGAEIAVSDLRLRIETVCHEYLSARRTPEWIPNLIGPVLAAGLAVAHRPEDSDTLIAFWRTCGLIKPRHFSVAGSIRLLESYGVNEQNPLPSSHTIALVAADTGRNPAKLPERPDLSDMIHWLNRETHSHYLHEVCLAIAHKLMNSNSWWRWESARLKELILNSQDRQDRCRRYINACNQCDATELRALFNGTPTNAMLNYVVSLEIAKEFTSQYYNSVRGSQKSPAKPLDSVALGV